MKDVYGNEFEPKAVLYLPIEQPVYPLALPITQEPRLLTDEQLRELNGMGK